jgi:hypothetical protein
MDPTATALEFVLMGLAGGFLGGCMAGYGFRMLVEKWERPHDYEDYVREVRQSASRNKD